ncbi:MAG: hypothetical protein WD512_03420 [Candidatus Paceibacterota bacterium]
MKNQKPIGLDLHFKYLCVNKDCGYHHWLSLKETQVKNFKIVCDCGTIFRPKRIKNIKINYLSKIKKISLTSNEDNNIPHDLLDKSIKILLGYGFEKSESEKLLKDSYSIRPELDCGKLVKNTLVLFGERS